MPSLPDTMLACELREYFRDRVELTTIHKPVPQPRKGQVLVQIAASSINPSDLAFLRGIYGIKKKVPVTPGFEACGLVVASGGGFFANALKGKRVACFAGATGDGTWAEYMVADAKSCLPIGKNITDEQGATALVNPLTAWALIKIAQEAGAKALIQNAAAGALGKMLDRLARKSGLKMINIVRRAEQAEALKAIGAEHVLLSEDPRMDRELMVLAKKLSATMAFDAIGGDATEKLARAMPSRSRVIVYGGLSGEACHISQGVLIFRELRAEGFWLSPWLERQSSLGMLRLAGKIQDLLSGELETHIQARYPVTEAQAAVDHYAKNMSAGKVLIVPGQKA
jgi:NADPH:quinone reductase-like Zn-dependent oxidoreductase